MFVLSFCCGRIERILRLVSLAVFVIVTFSLFKAQFYLKEHVSGKGSDETASRVAIAIETVQVATSYDPLKNVDWNRYFGTSRPQIDWKTVDLDSMTIHQIFDYVKWSNEDACEFSQFFGGRLNRSIRVGQKAVSENPVNELPLRTT